MKGFFASWKYWQIILLFGFLQCGLTALGVYFFDFFAGRTHRRARGRPRA